jgi:hypothetical protein
MSEIMQNWIAAILLMLLALTLWGFDIKSDRELTKYKEQLHVEFARY